MIARPVLFSGSMVRALRSGAKTQTRRTSKLEYFSENDPDNWRCVRMRDGVAFMVYQNCPGEREVKCPYGKAGDLLWVREIWRVSKRWDDTKPSELPGGNGVGQTVFFAAGGSRAHDELGGLFVNSEEYPAGQALPEWAGKLRPGMFMPRWASRLTLRITDVRVERLNSISEADAIAEGIRRWNHNEWAIDAEGTYHAFQARLVYWRLWNQLNGADAWDSNPFVWRIAFTIEKRNVDDVMRTAA